MTNISISGGLLKLSSLKVRLIVTMAIEKQSYALGIASYLTTFEANMCQNSSETTSYFFLKCPKFRVKIIFKYRYILSMKGEAWMMNKGDVNILDSFCTSVYKKS
jgi:hypothetical protein